MPPDLLDALDDMRRRHGFLEIAAMLDLMRGGTVVFDPFSTLIAGNARLGRRNLFYPGVTLLCADGAELVIGDGNVFHGGTLIAAETGAITIGHGNAFGEGGFTARANRPGARIGIGDHGRYRGGASVYGQTDLGSGSQLLGMIAVESCRLGAGGSHEEPDPDRRGGLLKGAGTARNLVVGTGEVIVGQGVFHAADLTRQAAFHPQAKP